MAEEKYLHNLRFITSVQYSKSMLKALNNVTFIYDPNWSAGNGDEPTFPVSFYHVKGVHEIMESEVSQKTLLFYNDSSNLANSGLKGAMTNVVADNVVIKPKQYKLDIILPFNSSTLLTDNFAMNGVASVTNFVVAGTEARTNDFSEFLGYVSYKSAYMELLRYIIEGLMSANYSASTSEMISSMLSTPDYNKSSLEAMWKNRSILKMKMWNSWRYKYVVITNLDITKESTEDGVYEASMTVQEMPIMTFRKTDKLPTPGYTNAILSGTGELIKLLLDEKGE